jgi:serine/threonine-protein kinase
VLQAGQIIGGRLRIERVIGAGGMATVVAASHLELQHEVAVKVLHDEGAANPVIVERFLREARAVAKLRTEHVCRVLDVGRLDDGAPYVVMELLSGTDLQSAIADAPLPPPLACEYIIQACVALAEAHAAGVVHRDLKPANLFVTRGSDGGRLVKVLDFGIAKAATAAEARLTHTTAMLGSPAFMSPEQILSARDVDLRTDIWALGATLHFLLSRSLPFEGGNATELATHVLVSPPRELAVEPGLQAVVRRCLEKAPEARYPDVASLANALAPFAGPEARRFVEAITGARPVAAPSPPGHQARKLAVIAAASAGDGGASTAGVLLFRDTAPRAAALAVEAPSAPPLPMLDAETTTVAIPDAPPDAAPPDAAPPAPPDAGTTTVTSPATPPDTRSPKAKAPCPGKSKLSAVERQQLRDPDAILSNTSDEDGYQNALLPLVQTLCECHDLRAQKYYDLMTIPKNREYIKNQCPKLEDRALTRRQRGTN